MDSNENEIKVSVGSSSNEDVKEKKTEAKKVVKKTKKPLKKTVTKIKNKKIAEKTESTPIRKSIKQGKNVETEKTKTKKNKKGKSVFSHFIVFVFTAVVIGGGVYYWQNKMTEEAKDKLSKDARSVRFDFEKRLENLTDKLKGTESEFEELKEKNEELAGKASLLEGALIKFESKELGISFNYPAIFGEVKLDITNEKDGKKFRGTFPDNEDLVFGGISFNYFNATSSSYIISDFLDVKTYFKKGEGDKTEYYYQTMHGKEDSYKIEPMRIVKSFGDDVLMVNKDSFVADDDGNIWDFGLGQDIGAIVKLAGDDFQGLAFINGNTAKFPLADFEETLKSIK